MTGQTIFLGEGEVGDWFAKGGFVHRDSNEAAAARDEENTLRDEDDILADVQIPDNMVHEQLVLGARKHGQRSGCFCGDVQCQPAASCPR